MSGQQIGLLIVAGYALIWIAAAVIGTLAVMATGWLLRRRNIDIEALADATREPRWTIADWQKREKELNDR